MKLLVVLLLLLAFVAPALGKAFVAETCCINCHYKNVLDCCCPKRRTTTITKTSIRSVTRTLCSKAAAGTARANPVSPAVVGAAPLLFRRHLCPACAATKSGPCCPANVQIKRTVWRTRTFTRFTRCPTSIAKKSSTANITTKVALTTILAQTTQPGPSTTTKATFAVGIRTPTTQPALTTTTKATVAVGIQTRTPTTTIVETSTKLTSDTTLVTTSGTASLTQTSSTETPSSTTIVTSTSETTQTQTPTPVAIYDSIPAVLPWNIASQGFQCCQTSEFGDQIQFANGSRKLVSAQVALSVWAIRSTYPLIGDALGWDQVLTLNLYNVGANDGNGNPTLGTLLGTLSTTFHIPWRPEPDPVNCPTKSSPGYDYKYQAIAGATDTNCFNGLATTVTFDLTSLGLVVPDQIVWGVAFNTQSYGTTPTGVAGPYNSLNVGAEGTAASVGTDVAPNVAWISTLFAGFYCDNGAGGTGTFRPDVGCSSGNDWTGYTPQIKFTAI